jgi:hypothetical protein
MDREHIIQTLDQLHGLLSPVKKPWFIIGTTGLMLSSFDVEPNDIDILTDTQTAAEIKILLKSFEFPLILKDDGKFRSAFSRYIIGGVGVEIMGDLQVNTANSWTDVLSLIDHPQQVQSNGKFFQIPSITEQRKIYSLFGRKKDVLALKLLQA